ncbi:MAG: glycosyltransferase 87 family protein [Anaerolineae bacterium]
MNWLHPSVPTNRRLPPWVLGIVLALVAFMFVWPETGVDVLVTYGPAGRGEYIEGLLPRNPRFSLWLFWLFARLPWKWDYLALMLASIPVLAAAVRWGGGDYRKAFLSFPFVWLLAYGQIDAFVAAGIALAWWALRHEWFWVMGIGLSFASMLKPQMGIFAALCLWCWSPNKWKPLVIPAVLVALSLLQWGWDWPIKWVRATLEQVATLEADWANASPASWLGWWAWLIWLPVLLTPMDRLARLRCVMAATALSLPYFPAYQLLILLVFPVSVAEWALTGLPLLGGGGYAAAALVPLLVVVVSAWPWAARTARRWLHRYSSLE